MNEILQKLYPYSRDQAINDILSILQTSFHTAFLTKQQKQKNSKSTKKSS